MLIRKEIIFGHCVVQLYYFHCLSINSSITDSWTHGFWLGAATMHFSRDISHNPFQFLRQISTLLRFIFSIKEKHILLANFIFEYHNWLVSTIYQIFLAFACGIKFFPLRRPVFGRLLGSSNSLYEIKAGTNLTKLLIQQRMLQITSP